MAQAFFDFLPDATTVLSFLLVLFFLYTGLYKSYPIFFIYWIFDLLIFSLPLLIPDFPTAMTVQAICFVIRCFLYFLLVSELMGRIFEDHPGLAKLGRRAVHAVMVIAAGAAIYTLRFDSNAPKLLGEQLHLLLQMERVVPGCLLLFLIIIVSVLWFFPVRLSRNTKAYCFGFAAFFLVKAIAPFLINTRGLDAIGPASTVHLIGVLACQIMWLFAISKRGVQTSPAFPRSWTPDEQQRILGTLSAFEQQISRTRGR